MRDLSVVSRQLSVVLMFDAGFRVRRGSPDPAVSPTAGLLNFGETCGRFQWLGQETGHNAAILEFGFL